MDDAKVGLHYASRLYLCGVFLFCNGVFAMASSYTIRQSELQEAGQLQVNAAGGVTTVHTHWQGNTGVGSLSVVSEHLPGFELMEISAELQQSLSVDALDGMPWVGMLYQEVGAIESTLSRGQRPTQVSGGLHNARIERNDRNRHTLYPQQGRYRAFNIQVDNRFFLDLIAQQPDWQPFYQGRPVQAEGSFMLLPHSTAPSPAVALAVQQLRNCPYAGTLKKMYLEARFLDLFIAQHEQYTQPQQLPRRQKVDVFYNIRDFLDAHYADDLSLLGLARQFGINDCKLKQGFKAAFGTTVFGYLAEKRLTTARALLEASTLPVQEVGEAVGFANPAHFATVFKKKFGMAPSQLRR